MHSKKYLLYLFSFIVLLNTGLFAKNPDKAVVTEYINRYSDSFAAQADFKGSILVAVHNKVIFKKAYGYSNYASKQLNITGTKYLLASMTKQFTAMGILILCNNGKLTLEDPLYKYIPQFPDSKTITLHSLLTHTSGLAPVFYTYYTETAHPDNFIDLIISAIDNKRIHFAYNPGAQKFTYSDINYQVLGAVIEIVSKQSYESFIDSVIFAPLKMKNSGFGYNRVKTPGMAICYLPDKKPFLINLDSVQLAYAAGSIYSTVDDLFIWDQALNNNILIPSQYSKKMFTKYYNTYGYGWWFYDFNKNGKTYSFPQHGGRHLNGMSSCFFIRNTDSNSCVIILGNDGDHDSKKKYAQHISQYLAN